MVDNIQKGEPGEPGLPGEPGIGGGGSGGHGGAGGSGGYGLGTIGPQGPQGPQGPRGPRGEIGHPRKYGPLFGFLVASAIMSVLVYYLQFQVRDELIKSCERVNVTRNEVNQRASVINSIITQEQNEPAHGNKPLPLATKVTLTDCPAQFHRPWPFN